MTASVHPARSHPHKCLALVLFVLVSGVTLSRLLPSLTTLALASALLLSLSDFFLPTRYEFGEEAVEQYRGPFRSRYPWKRFATFSLDRNGILLSPFAVRHPLENFRGVFLALGREDRERVAPWLSRKLTRLS